MSQIRFQSGLRFNNAVAFVDGGAGARKAKFFTDSAVQPDIDGFSLAEGAIDPSAVVTGIQDFWLAPDGTKLYIADISNTMFQIPLSTPWDIGSAGTRVAAAMGTQPWAAVQLSADGTKCYGWEGLQSSDILWSADCDTEYDITAVSNLTAHAGTTANPTTGEGLYVLDDGSGIYYVLDSADRKFDKWTMSTPGLASSGSLTTADVLDVSVQAAAIDGFDFSPDGSKLYVLDGVNDVVYQYNCGTPYDLSTASYASKSLTLTDRDTPTGIFIRRDTGTTMFIMYGGAGVPLFDRYTLA